MSIKDWLNGTSMTSMKEFVGICLMVVVVVWFTGVSAGMLTVGPDDFHGKVPLSVDPKKLSETLTVYLAMGDSYMNNTRTTGFNLALAILAAIGLVKGITTYQHGKDRDTSKEKILHEGEAQASIERAKMEGQIAGTAAAATAAQLVEEARNGRTTKDRPAMQVNTENAEITQEVKNGSVRSGE